MRIKKIITAILLILVCSAVIQPSFAQDERKKIRVRGDYKYPPYEFLVNGKPIGFNIDLIRAIAGVMGLEIEIDLGPWHEVREDLESGEIDIITGMYYSTERDKTVDFSNPYLLVTHAIFVRNGKPIRSLEDIKGQEIIVQEGDIMHDFLVESKLTDKIISVDSQSEALKMLAEGKHDCALLAKLQGVYLINRNNYKNVRPLNISILPSEYCFAVKAGDDFLLSLLNEGLSIIKANGTYAAIHRKWFGVEGTGFSANEIVKYGVWVVVPLLVLALAGFALTWRMKKNLTDNSVQLTRTDKDKKQAQSSLELSEKRYRELYQNIDEGVLKTDMNGRIIEANNAFRMMSGYSEEELKDLDSKKITPEKWHKEEDRIIAEEVLKKGVSEKYTKEYIKKDGAVFSAELKTFLIRDPQGMASGLWTIVKHAG